MLSIAHNEKVGKRVLKSYPNYLYNNFPATIEILRNEKVLSKFHALYVAEFSKEMVLAVDALLTQQGMFVDVFPIFYSCLYTISFTICVVLN